LNDPNNFVTVRQTEEGFGFPACCVGQSGVPPDLQWQDIQIAIKTETEGGEEESR